MGEVGMSSEGGTKSDKGKPPITLIPREALEGCAQALAYGANKYSPHNFKGGIRYSRLADAAMRHVIAFIDGENQDPESGLSHIDHALASLAMLKYMIVNNEIVLDDRYNKETKKVNNEGA